MIRALLKYINSMPFPFTMRHYQVFGDASSKLKNKALISVESWDVLRQEHPHFSIPTNRLEWLKASELGVIKDGQDGKMIERARDIVNLLHDEKIDRIFSVGVGGAGLEYQIKKLMPEVKLVCSEYSTLNVDILKKVFLESDEIIKFDVFEGDWRSINEKYIGKNGVCLFYRLDAGFSDKNWKLIFKKVYEAGVDRIIFIPTGTLTILSIVNRKMREMKWFFSRIQTSFCGFIRTKKRFEKYWDLYYEKKDLTLGSLKSFLLNRRK